jgi:hypothetical protein
MDDNIYRMTNQTIAADPASVNGSLTYGLDPVGNRLSLTSSVTPIPSQSFTYDAKDRISGDTQCLVHFVERTNCGCSTPRGGASGVRNLWHDESR